LRGTYYAGLSRSRAFSAFFVPLLISLLYYRPFERRCGSAFLADCWFLDAVSRSCRSLLCLFGVLVSLQFRVLWFGRFWAFRFFLLVPSLYSLLYLSLFIADGGLRSARYLLLWFCLVALRVPCILLACPLCLADDSAGLGTCGCLSASTLSPHRLSAFRNDGGHASP